MNSLDFSLMIEFDLRDCLFADWVNKPSRSQLMESVDPSRAEPLLSKQLPNTKERAISVVFMEKQNARDNVI